MRKPNNVQRACPPSGVVVCLTALMVCLARSACAQTTATVDLVADLLETFGSAQVKDSLSCEVRRPSSAGGVKENALFEHPQSLDRPARVEYQLQLPSIAKGDLLLLAFDIALADGTKLGPADDGVRFSVEVEGKRRFAKVSRENVWRAHALELTEYAGRQVMLGLLTEAMKNSSYDWAVWGNPRVLHFRGSAQVRSELAGRFSFARPVGVVAFRQGSEAPSKIRVRPAGTGAPLEWTEAVAASVGDEPGWLVKDFSFPEAMAVDLEWEPLTTLAATNLFVAAYRAEPGIAQLSATRALITAGETVSLRVQIRNEGRGTLAEGEAGIELQAGEDRLPPRSLPALAPNESWQGEWAWKTPPRGGVYPLHSRLTHGTKKKQKAGAVETFAAAPAAEGATIQNAVLKIEFARPSDGYAYADVFARQNNQWTKVALWKPLFQLVSETEGKDSAREIRPQTLRRSQEQGRESLELVGSQRDEDGVEWQAKLSVTLETDRGEAILHYEWSASGPRRVKALWGPNIYVGDGTTGEAKSWGLFPGLEYLYGGESSSNPRDFAAPLQDRRTPHPHKITLPLMAVTVGPGSQMPPEKPARFFAPDSLKDQPRLAERDSGQANALPPSDVTVALSWNPLQRWDREHSFPSARFASPNFDEGMRNHRLALFLPSVPEFVPENGDRATRPFLLPAGKVLTLDATLMVVPGMVNAAMRHWLRAGGGLPKPNPPPRSFQEELDVCRTGFLKTLWDDPSQKWRHCIGWPASHAPGFAALLWLDSKLAEKPEARQQSRARVELAATNMLRDGGAGLLMSQANCHIMQWEFPFLYGHLPEAMAGVEGMVRQLISTQQPNGAWLYQPGNAEQADLGQAGDSVLGTCANRASTVLRYARITGDAAALRAGEKALQFMEGFRLPRGGQTWECPMYEPDILAAAYAIRACHDAYRATGNPRWLHDAVYWAETGVPFIYMWALPDRPMMLGGTIPVFGSTFYTHTWLAVPVQWCGLVYSYHLFHLAEEIENNSWKSPDSPLPLSLNFSPADWKRIVELITVSGMRQQYADGERAGSYPDSLTRFEQRNPAFINPEDIVANLLALQGHDPDVRTARMRNSRGEEVVVSSGARVKELKPAENGVRFQLRFFPGEVSHSLIAGLKPREVRVGGNPLPQSAGPIRREAGWWWDETRRRLYLAVPHRTQVVEVEVVE